MMKEHNDPDLPIILLGNKIDTIGEDKRKIIAEASEKFVKDYGLSGYYFCSAKSGEGISSPFSHLGILLVEREKRNRG